MSRDIPIIFSGPMVRALLDGRKTMTRRLAWSRLRGGIANACKIEVPSPWRKVKAGDRLWVRENWRADDWAPADVSRTIYMADAPADVLRETKGIIKWRPCIHLPRDRSRLTLIVTATKIERLQEINEQDARAEGVERRTAGHDGTPFKTFRAGFVYVWRDLHGPQSWLDSPEVVALTFTVHKQNIDALQQAA